jgi:hypothetical protein
MASASQIDWNTFTRVFFSSAELSKNDNKNDNYQMIQKRIHGETKKALGTLGTIR